MKGKRRRWVILAALAIVIAGSLLLIWVRRQPATIATEAAAPNVPLAVARNGDFI